MNAEIIAIGSELAIGRAVDTNTAWLAQKLAAVGISTTRHVTVADDLADITLAIAESAGRAPLVIVTGGLGPTSDDLTRQALADALGVVLELDPGSLARIEAFFKQRAREMHPANRVQAMLPRGAESIDNPCGTAPGIRARLKKADVFVLPGVPAEMKAMFDAAVLPALKARSSGAVILQDSLLTFGMSEAQLGEMILDLMARGRNPAVGTSASDLIIAIHLYAEAPTTHEARRLLDADLVEIRRRLGKVVFGGAGQSLAESVARLLTEKNVTVSTAESCTGGLIAKRLTDVPGSSAYFVQSFVTYADDAKRRLLDIPASLIDRCGAVSREVAEAMAANCRRLAATDYALSATGIAGPTGATPGKPVGLVFLALAGPDGVAVKELRLGESLTRRDIRDRTAKSALNWLRLELLRRNQ